MNEEKVVWVFG